MSRPEKRRGGPVLLAGLGGFAVGAATVLLVVWVYGVSPSGDAAAPTAVAGAPRRAPEAPHSTSGGRSTGLQPSAPLDPLPPDAERGPSVGGADVPRASSGAPAPAGQGGGAEVVDLLNRHLLLPVQGIRREELRDSFSEGRTGHTHEAIDILAPRNTPVLAVEEGKLAKLFWSQRGGKTIYQFDPSATYAYYYAHLERYADGLHEGDLLHRGQVIGYVGTSGNAPPETPHLHFSIFLLTPEKHWWQGTPINPYPVFRQP
jgi:peptidoglycan LD-endopeptidase LytH